MPRSSILALALALAPLARADEKKDDKKGELKPTADEQALLDLTNAERKKADLEPLKMNPKLMEAARKHAENMAKQDKLAHVLDEKEPVDRAKAAGYKSTYIGENVSWNQKDPKEALAEWMDSEPHRANIL